MAYSYDGYLRFGTKVDQSGFDKGVNSLKSAASIGAKAVAVSLGAATGAVTALSVASIRAGSNFEEGMSKVSAISGATASDLQALADKAKEMGATTKFSATESAEALQYMAMAGWKTEQMLSGLPGVMNLAAASGEDLATVSDIVTDAMTAFGLKAEESAHFADVLAAASSNANTNVGMMGYTFKYAAPLAGALGYTIEDTALAIGLMANAGIKSETAGTALRSMFSEMTGAVELTGDKLGKYVIELERADGTMVPLGETIRSLREAFSQMTEAEKIANAESLVGKEAMSGLLAIVNASQSDYNKLSAAIQNADGSAQNMADTMNDNLKGDLTILGSTAESVGIRIYDKFETPMRSAAQAATESMNDVLRSLNGGQLDKSVDKIADSAGNLLAKTAELTANGLPKLLDGFTYLIDHGKEVKSTVMGISAAVVAYKSKSVFTSVISGWKKVSGVINAQTKATGLATKAQLIMNAAISANPAAVAAVAIGALTAGLVALSQQENETKKHTRELNDALDEQISEREEAEKARREAIDGAVTEIDHATSLIDKYDDITDANGKVKEGYEGRARALQEQINSIIPNAISLSEREGDMYLQVADNLELLMKKKKVSALVEADQDAYIEALKNENENINALRTAKEDLATAEEELQKAREEYAEYSEYAHQESPYFKQRIKDLEDDVEAGWRNVEEKKKILNANIKLQEDQEAAEEALYSDSLEKLDAVLDDRLNATATYTNKNKEEMDKQLSDISGNYIALIDLAKEKGEELSELEIDRLAKTRKQLKTEVDAYLATGEKIPLNLAQGILNTEATFKSSVENLFRSGKIDHEQYVKLMGTVGSNWGNALAESSDSEEVIGKIKAAAENNANTATESIKKVWKIENETSGAGSEIGGYYADGVAKGMISETSLRKIRANGTILGQTADKATRKALKIESPSKVGMETGGFYGEGFAIGIEQSSGMVQDAISTLSNNAITMAKGKATSYKEIGSLYIESMENSINGKTDSIIKQVEKLVNEQTEAHIETLGKNDQKAKDKYRESARETMDTYKAAFRKGASEVNALLKEKIQDITETAQKQYDEIIKQRERMQEKLSDFGDLFTRDDDGEVQLENIDKQIDAIERYEEALEKLQEKGIAEGLLNEIVNMGVEDGTDFAEELLSKSESTFERYNQAWTEKQELAKTVAEKFYADELETLDKDFTQKLDTALASIPEECTNVGVDAIKGTIEGMESQRGEAVATARSIADAIIKELKRATETASPSKRAAREVGKPLTQGIVKGMKDAYDPKEMERYADRMMADVGQSQSKAAQSVLHKNTSNIWNSSTYNGGDFVLKIEKMVNDGKGSVSSLLQEAEFYRKQKVSATGGS
ncbi:phage tail tape measure protein [Anaerotignum sp. MB30-C6]|uniref:phage tail tape measure protein n=1 Tax=Anaerotignum sp. MB30-C6 TaxID=3070814 RepID=UPI0027DCDC5B|nr:phage tail tape measure protein [Anaerotignum sp. MB30-C6]WMI81949.1 phage tail tape measure protein [Anaerotignum sp. MB30-C6]